MLTSIFLCWALGFNALLPVKAIQLDISSTDSVKSAAKTIAKDLLQYYHGTKPGNVLGILDEDDYYWWQAGATWAGLIDYWKYTGDDQYVDLVQQALLSQVGPESDYMPPNQTKTEGNDDQAMWALAAMTAAETKFPNNSSSPSWLELAQNTFDLQVARWDKSSCGGGLRWQIFSFNKGYDYKNSLSQATFFQLAARLAKYTGNQTYTEWADKAWNWTTSVGLITSDSTVFDGAMTSTNCSGITKLQWTYTAGAFLYGSAVMYNETNGDSKWQDRTAKLLSAMSVFFSKSSGIMVEVTCEDQGTCNRDQHSFKGLTAQWMGLTMQAAPFTADKILSYLRPSAKGAAAQCSGGKNGTLCGFKWTGPKWDGSQGAGQQLGAMNVVLANLALDAPVPVKGSGTTSGNSSATTSSSAGPTSQAYSPSSAAQALQVHFVTGVLALGVGILLLY